MTDEIICFAKWQMHLNVMQNDRCIYMLCKMIDAFSYAKLHAFKCFAKWQMNLNATKNYRWI